MKEQAKTSKSIAILKAAHEAFVSTEKTKVGFHEKETDRKIKALEDDLKSHEEYNALEVKKLKHEE